MADSPYIMVATPCFAGQLVLGYVDSVLALQRSFLERGIKNTFVFRGEPLITRLRANMTAHFLRSEATHLLFIDADIEFSPEQVFRLLAFDADVTAAAYPLKRINWNAVRRAAKAGRTDFETAGLEYVLYPESKGPMTARDDFVRVRHTGTGFLMIRRAALVRMCEAHPELRYKESHPEFGLAKGGPYNHALFECMIEPETGLYLSEDYAFCRRWRDLGGEIWLDIRSKLTHHGPSQFRGDLAKQFTPVGA